VLSESLEVLLVFHLVLVVEDEEGPSAGVGRVPELEGRPCNTLGVYHQLSSGFKLKHDRLMEMTMSKSNLWK
jgi:hypothetical protein